MKDSLKPGLDYTLRFIVPESKTVPNLFPESDIFTSMPNVLATGFMVGLMEWACTELMRPHLEDGEGSLGVHIDVSHSAATPPGMTVEVHAKCLEVDGRRLKFQVSARDERDVIGEGIHRRFVVNWDRFNSGVAEKAALTAGKARG
ncbi:MAG: thioesterase family protein [Alphaproteobacteria bacterium]|nr:thioesterase family protein [Alphaproteobacteria bacterium]